MTLKHLLNACNASPDIHITVLAHTNSRLYSQVYSDLYDTAPAALYDLPVYTFTVTGLEMTRGCSQPRITSMTIYVDN